MNQSITLTPADIELFLQLGFWYLFAAVFFALLVYDFGFALPGIIYRIYRMFRGSVEKPVGGKSE